MKNGIYLMLIVFFTITLSAKSQTKINCLLGDTTTVHLAYARGDIQWQNSGDSLIWQNLEGQTTGTLNFIPVAGNQWVRAIVNEANCPVFFEDPIRISAIDTSSATFISDVVVLDTVAVIFQPDSLQQLNGIYRFSCQSDMPPLNPGDIIIGTEGEGYLRFVNGVVLQNGILTAYTDQATLNDLFDDASFSFDISNDSLDSRSTGFNYDFDQTELINTGPLTLTLNSGNVEMTGTWGSNMSFSLLNGLQSFYFGTNDVNLSVNAEFNLQASQEVTLLSGSKSLASFTRPIFFLLGGFPVIITLSAELIGTYELDLNSEIQMDANFTSNVAIQTGLSYSNGQWNNTFNIDPANEIEFSSPEGQVQAVLKLALIPELKMKIYGVVVPYLKPSAHMDVFGTVSSPELNWDVKGMAYGGLTYGVENIEILDNTIATFTPIVYESEHEELYRTPYAIETVSGNNQSGEVNSPLSNPIVLRVIDSFGLGQSNVQVEVQVSSGNGTVSEDSLITDSNGEASVMWTLGNDSLVIQALNFIVRDGSNVEIGSSPHTVIATIGQGCGSGFEFVTDVDGNEYPIVQIGDQVWMTKNLSTTHFADSTEIPNVPDSAAWLQLTSPGWCYLENNSAYNISYGKLYNWYTVSDPRNLCPTGWHVPTQLDWMELSNFLGGDAVSGGAMKCLNGWVSPNVGATNESGFSAIPSGGRANTSEFLNDGDVGAWWSSTERLEFNDAWGRYVINIEEIFYEDGLSKINGLSVRCIQD